MKGGRLFLAMDRLLDAARTGPRYLMIPEVAELVIAAMSGESRIDIHAYAVMSNHVHMLVTASVSRTQWLGHLKGVTAFEANRWLGRRGSPFWQDESYDPLVRSTVELSRIRAYIENNPVKAGLVHSPEDFRWSSDYARVTR